MEKKAERNSGIDLLRVVLSFAIITLHILHYGGFQAHIRPDSLSFYILWLLGVLLSSAVNCFAIISGFVLYDSKIKHFNILRLFLTVVYHGIVVTLLFRIFFSQSVDNVNWIQAFLPITQEEFWYFNSYFGAFFLLPIVIAGMEKLPKKEADKLVISLVFVFSVIPLFSASDPFDLNEGYSALWLLVLFILGTYLKKFNAELKIKRVLLVGIFFICIAATCSAMALSAIFPALDGMTLMRYTSPTLVVAAVAVVLLFARLPVPAFIRKASSYCASFSFSIYLLHEHPLVREYLIQERFVFVLEWPAIVQVFAVFAITVGIWAVCFGLEWIRRLVFRLLRIDKVLKNAEEKYLQSNASVPSDY